jgi:hypothetical protein
MNVGRRLQIEAPEHMAWRKTEGFTPIYPWSTWYGHSSDDYGNCSVFIKVAALGGIVLFWEPPSHFQRDVELPAMGASKWIDRRYYHGLDDAQ